MFVRSSASISVIFLPATYETIELSKPESAWSLQVRRLLLGLLLHLLKPWCAKRLIQSPGISMFFCSSASFFLCSCFSTSRRFLSSSCLTIEAALSALLLHAIAS